MISFERPIWEIALRATAVYLVLAIVLRLVPKRHLGSMSPNDLIALVLIAGLAADAIAVGATSTPDLLLMVALVVLWDYILNWLEYHVRWFRRVSQDTPTLLIHRGHLLRKNLRRELMTEEELTASLRMHGIEDIRAVRHAVLEVDGQISIVRFDGDDDGPPPPPRSGSI